MPEYSLHADMFRDIIQDAGHNPLVTKWPAGVQKQVAHLGMTSPFPECVLGTVDGLTTLSFQPGSRQSFLNILTFIHPVAIGAELDMH